MNMLEEIFIDILEKLWEVNKPYLEKGVEFATAGFMTNLGYRKVKKKVYPKYLNYKIKDIYNPANLTKHVWISGVQGSGKSNKLRRIFVNTFIKKGWGGIYIDTHGTADEILLSIPPNRWKDVIYIAPWMKRVYGINALQKYSDDEGEIDRITEDVISVFSKIYSRSWGDKLENDFRFATKAVLLAEEKNEKFKNPTLIDVHRVLSSEAFRRDFIKPYIENEIIRDFLDGLKATNALNKLKRPLSSENILLFTCQKNGLNIFEAMENNKIIICNFDNDKLSSNSNLMAGIILGIVAQCAAKRSENKSHPYFGVALDEFYDYANKSINVLIEQMRKKNVCLLLANQHRDQLPTHIQSAVSMCQTKFIHTPADNDLNWVSSLYKKWYTKDEIIEMPFFHCIHDVHISGKKRNPKMGPTPKYIGDYDWEYVHKLKFASLNGANSRYKLLEELNKQHNYYVEEDDIDLDGGINYDE